MGEINTQNLKVTTEQKDSLIENGHPHEAPIKLPFKIAEVTLVPHSHWDYAWYRARTESRIREAETLGGVLDALRDGQMSSYTLEQSITAREYFEGLGKHRKDEFIQYCQEGKIEFIGLEIQPEPFLPCEEAFFWNVEIGRDFAEEHNIKTSEVLYIPDSFGFPASYPKIVRAAGLDNLLFTRGIPHQIEELGAVYNWESDDGSSILAIPMPGGYGIGNQIGRYKIIDGKYIFHHDKPEIWNDTALEFLRRFLKKYNNRYEVSNLPHALIGNGSDFEEIDIHMPAIAAYCEEKLQEDYPGIQLRFGNYGEYLNDLKQKVDLGLLKEFKGELRDGAEHRTTRGVESTRMPLKQAAERAEREIQTADTLTALLILSRKYGRTSADGHSIDTLNKALIDVKKTILPVHSHDAICGCGTDDIYMDLFARIGQAEGGAYQIKRNCVAALANTKDKYGINTNYGENVSIINSLNYPRIGLVEIPLPEFLYGEDYVIAETEDGELPVQVIERDGKKYGVTSIGVDGLNTKQIHLKAASINGHDKLEMSKRQENNSVSNEFYLVQAQSDGTLTITDKATGLNLGGLVFEECGDMGDEYNFCPIDNDQLKFTAGGEAAMKVLSDGPVFTELQIDTSILAPEGLAENEVSRSAKTVIVPITTIVRLIKGVDRIEFTTTINNTAKDHRLRVRFQTPNTADTVRAKEPYGMVEREAVPIKGGDGWQEPLPFATSHHQGLVVAGNLELYSKGLPEYEAIPGDGNNINEIALTLIRGVGYLSRGDLKTRTMHTGPYARTPDAQCLGVNTYEYGISLRGSENNQSAINRSNEYLKDLEIGPENINLKNILNIDSKGAVVSAIKPSRDGEGVMVRLYNPTDLKTSVSIDGMFESAAKCDAIWGTPLDKTNARDFIMGNGEIVTVLLS
jgi:mannosylglycerate hydrolase